MHSICIWGNIVQTSEPFTPSLSWNTWFKLHLGMLCMGEWQSTVDLFYWAQRCSDGGTWRYMFRPHSNSWTPGPGWVQSNGDGPPFPTVNSEWGEREWQKGDQNGITATWELVLIFWNYRFFHLLAIAEKVEIWANTLSQSRAATPSKPSKEGYLYSDLIGPRNECRWLKLINKDRRINWLALWW